MSTALVEFEVGQLPVSSDQQDGSAPAPRPEDVLTQLIIGNLASQAVYVAAKLGIADLLAEGPKSVDEIARVTGSDSPSLYRVLRALAAGGVFEELPGRVFDLSPAAQGLRSNAAGSLRDLAIFWGEDWHWRVWGQSLYSVKTGRPAWGLVHGNEVFEYFQANANKAEIFDRAMTSASNLAINAVLEAFDFSGIETLVDIAGGHGALLKSIVSANPSMKGILFDLPHVIDRARETVGVPERCQLVSGDFFAGVPAGADAYIMKHIIHDWDDERALQILTNINRVMKDHARVLLVEAVISETSGMDFGKLLDIEMLVSAGGKERTAAEYRELLARAGLRLNRIVPTKSPYSVIEAVGSGE